MSEEAEKPKKSAEDCALAVLEEFAAGMAKVNLWICDTAGLIKVQEQLGKKTWVMATEAGLPVEEAFKAEMALCQLFWLWFGMGEGWQAHEKGQADPRVVFPFEVPNRAKDD